MEPTPSSVSSSDKKSKLTFSIDLRWICLALLAIIVAMFLFWKPWTEASNPTARTVTVTGDSTVRATPDEYAFNPYYHITNADKATAVKEAEAKRQQVVAGLKTAGAADKQIKSFVDGHQSNSFSTSDNLERLPSSPDGAYVYTVRLTVTIPSKDTAQKIQDYLLTTDPIGEVTPQPSFSQTTRKKLEAKARDEATHDARAKADQSAKNLGFSVGHVKSVNDGSGFGGNMRPMVTTMQNGSDVKNTAPSTEATIQPGENELSYNVTVVYYIK